MVRSIARVLWRPCLLALLALVAAFFGAAAVTPYRTFNEAVIAIAAGFFAVGTVTYAPPALRVMLLPRWATREEWAAVAQFLFMISLAALCAWSLLWRLSDQPAFLVNNAVYDGRWLGFIVAVGIMLKAPNLFGAGVARSSRVALGAAWVMAILLVAFFWFARPDLQGVAERLRPYLDSGAGYGDPP